MNRQQLSEALAGWNMNDPMLSDIFAAARLVERLLPKTDQVPCPDGKAHCVYTHYDTVWDEGIVEAVARTFHEAYERLALSHGYETRIESRIAWPPPNADLMRDTARVVLSALVGLLTEKVET